MYVVFLSAPERRTSARSPTPCKIYGPFESEEEAWLWYEQVFALSVYYDREQGEYSEIEVLPIENVKE
jgi:hypothetical protein